jgi:hypothetical protein
MKACGADADRISEVLVLRRGSLLHSLGQETVAGDPVALKPQSDLGRFSTGTAPTSFPPR